MDAINIKLFGKFTISHEDKELSEDNLKTKQIVILTSYLTYNADKDVPSDNVYDILWPNDDSDNPAHALRNLIYRMRTILKNKLNNELKFIITLDNNNYCWNKEVPVKCDAAEFEKYINIASDAAVDKHERINKYLQADALYENDFLVNYSEHEWVVPLSTYYRHLYISSAQELVDLLIDECRYEEALKICIKATKFDRFNEILHRKIIKIYSELDQVNSAVRHYRYITNMFLKELGVKPGKETDDYYKKVALSRFSTESDIESIRRSLLSDDDMDTPLFCDYYTLKHLFSLQMRSLTRKKDSHYLILISIKPGGVKLTKNYIQDEMDAIAGILRKFLRKSDVVGRYSRSQYLLMLNSLTYENAKQVSERIDTEYSKSGKHTKVDFSIISIG